MAFFSSRVNVNVLNSDNNLSGKDVLERLLTRAPQAEAQGDQISFEAATQAEADKLLADTFRLRQIPGTDYSVSWSLPTAEGVNYYGG